MIYNAIQKKFMPICVGLVLPLIVSCDSDSDSGSGSGFESTTTVEPYVAVTGNGGAAPGDDISLNPTDKALIMAFYLLGDNISYTYIAGLDLVNDNTFNSANAADLNQVETNPHVFPMLFRKTDNYEFQLQGNSPNRGRAFEEGVRVLIGSPSALGGTFRERLLDAGTATPSFTRIELQNMVDDINASNPEGNPIVYLLPDRDLIVDLTFCTFTISHTSLSSNADLLRGAMDGSYTVDVTDARVIEFRRPTVDELSHFNWGIRGYTPSHWLPYIGDDKADIEGIQGGFYDMSLGNIPIGAVR